MAAASDRRWPPQAGGPAAPLFTVRITGENGQTVVWAAGELDLTVGAALGDALSAVPAVPGQLLIVDLTHLGFLDVTGLRLLIAADERLRAAGGAGLAVRGATGIVRRAFEIMRVTRLLDDHVVETGSPPRAAACPPGLIDRARLTAGWSVTDLFVAYFALGGTAELGALSAYLAGRGDDLDPHQRQLAVQALNERLLDLGHTGELLSFPPD